jgi:competence protein ComEC
MLTGYKQEIDVSARGVFYDLGIAHLFAVSGIHIGIIAKTIDFFLKIICMPKRFRVFPVLILLTFYVNAIGCSPSSLRALMMVAFYYISSLLGRKPTVLAALTNSALLHVLYDPFVVFNISFLLSYAVVAGMILMGLPLQGILSNIFLNLHGLKLESYPWIDRFLFWTKKFLITSFSISLAACLVSLPLSIDHFGTMSLLTVPVNMFVVPIATCAIVTGAMTLFFGLLGLWPICACLNKISCFLIHIFYILTKSFYYDCCCYRNMTICCISGAAWTMLILTCAHLIVGHKMFTRPSGITSSE